MAIMDWYSRFVLAWEISTTLDTSFCLSALKEALKLSKPEIFNTDQGSQFTSLEFTGRLEKEDIRISMDSRGRVYDNIFVERLWRSVKYEEVYLHQYQTVSEARNGLAKYFLFYNTERLHESLGYQTPYEVYVKEQGKINPVQASTIHHIQPCFLSVAVKRICHHNCFAILSPPIYMHFERPTPRVVWPWFGVARGLGL